MKIPGYTIVHELGSGGMATVYLARQDRLTRDVALKVMKPIAMAGDDFTSRFVKEGQIIAQLQHPQIVTIYDFDSSDGYHYFSMEYLPGGTLADEIKKGLAAARTIAITKKIAEALAVAHARGVIHRDVKPQNILFRSDGTPVLTDFGIARAVTRDAESMQLTSIGMVIGSPRYMSPEQSTGQPLDPRSDLYSLGVVFYEMLTNQLPYQADDVVSLAMKHCNDPIPELPDELAVYQSILDRMIAKKPEERFANAGQLIRALEGIEEQTRSTGATNEATRIVPRGESHPEPTHSGPAPGRSKLIYVIPALLVLTLGVFLAIRAYQGLVPPDPSPLDALIERLGLPAETPDRSVSAARYERLALEHFERLQFQQSLGLVRIGLSMTPEDKRLLVLESRIQDRLAAAQLAQEARDLIAENRLDEAAERTQAALARAPDHTGLQELQARIRALRTERDRRQAEDLLVRARREYDQKQYLTARSLVEQGLRLVASHPELTELGRKIDAAIRRQRDLQERVAKIRERMASQELSEALALIASALEVYPEDPELEDFRKTVLTQMDRSRQQRVGTLYEEAQTLCTQGDQDACLARVREGLALDPTHAGLAQLQEDIRSARERARLRQADATLAKARDCFERGDLDCSQRLADQGLAAYPEHTALLALREKIRTRRTAEQGLRERLRDCEQRFPVAELTPETSLAAQACYADILDRDPDNAQALGQLAKLADRLADQTAVRLDRFLLAEAETALEALEKLAPDHQRLAALREDLARRRSLSPETIGVPAGCFLMGSPLTEVGREEDERQHRVCIERFRLARHEVSVKDFKAFVEATGHRTDAERGTAGLAGCLAMDSDDQPEVWGYKPWASWRKPNKYQPTSDLDPVSCVSWSDAQAYIRWLSAQTGGRFRLPTEAEWEYAARAGSSTARFWAEETTEQSCRFANAADKGGGWDSGFACNDGYGWVAPVGSFKPSPWGLHDMLGNLWEWTCSEYDAGYSGSEMLCSPNGSYGPRVLRGGAWNSAPPLLRSAYRDRDTPISRRSYIGFRLALDPPEPASSE